MTTLETAPSTKRINDMPDHARTWVYKAARVLSAAEQRMVRDLGANFTGSWAAHGAELDATVDVLYDRFVVIAVDEVQAAASGCSIDKSVGFIKQLELDLNLTLTDRMIMYYEHPDKLSSFRLEELPELLKQGAITADTIVYDDLVSTVGDLRNQFRVPLHESWMERYLKG